MSEIRDIKKRLKRISEMLRELEEDLSMRYEIAPNIEGNILRILRKLIDLYYMTMDYIARGQEIYELVEGDDIKVWIIKTLYQYSEMNILQLTKAIRVNRGKASRRTISKKLEELERKNIVRKMVKGRRKIYYLNI